MQTTDTQPGQTPQAITTEQAAAAFELWENDFRANPDSFYTVEEVARQDVATVAEGRAITFMALLRHGASTSGKE